MGTWQGNGHNLANDLDDPEYRRQMRAERRRQKRAEEYMTMHWKQTPEGWDTEVGEFTAETPEWMTRMTTNPVWQSQMAESMEYWGDLKS